MASGTLPDYSSGKAVGGLPGKEVWSAIQVPVFLVGGEADHITKPEEVDIIAEFLGKENPISSPKVAHSDPVNDAAAPFDISKLESNDTSDGAEDAGEVVEKEAPPADASLPTHDATPESPEDLDAVYSDPSTPLEEFDTLPPQPPRPKKIVKTTILPAPANHACLYMPSTSRTLAGLISDFLSSHVSPRLSLGWQLQFLSTAGKWDVKNLEKWRAVTPVSQPIGGVFRAMKTLREVDEVHNPMTFVEMYGREVGDVVDISHDQPVYDPRGLERGGVRYHKFPTVSKIPPTDEEIRGFIQLVDRLRQEQKSENPDAMEKYIGVHCHYGFNRTGYFVVCYLVERLGFNVQSALEEFKLKRPNGIKHAHFMDGLYVRYCRGLRRQKTWME
jgi:protein-tyrosine phosphatase